MSLVKVPVGGYCLLLAWAGVKFFSMFVHPLVFGINFIALFLRDLRRSLEV
jgi:hypothetical protein